MKVVSYDPYNTAEPSGSLSGTSCPPQPHLEVMRTPPFLMYLETFPRGDHSMKVACCNPLDTPGSPGPGSINIHSPEVIYHQIILISQLVCRVFYFGDIYQMPFCICNYIELLFINKYVCKVVTYSPIDQTMSPVLGQLPNIFTDWCNDNILSKYFG